MRIAGTSALVTGASSGIGRAVALRLARLGADVVLVARRADVLEAVAQEARKTGRRIVVIPCDVSDRSAIERAVETAKQELGSIDILVNAAGFGVWKRFLDVRPDEHARMMDVMYWSAFAWTRAFLPDMLARRRGHIVNLSAGSGRFALPVTSGFSAAAAAVAALSEALHRELFGTGVGVTCVFPGSVNTPFWNERDIPRGSIPPLVRWSPRLSAEAVARNVCWCIRLRMPVRTLPIFVALLARANALWIRLGDLILWRWFVPALAVVLVLRLLLW